MGMLEDWKFRLNYRVGASVHRQIAAVLEDFAAELARVVAAGLFLVVHRAGTQADATAATAQAAQAAQATGATATTANR